jgi:O-6-methylguanine DNA methyltransferase
MCRIYFSLQSLRVEFAIVLSVKIAGLQLTLEDRMDLARLNDNLFTTLAILLKDADSGAGFETQMGRVRVRFSELGLTGLVFEESSVDAADAASLRSDEAGLVDSDVATPREWRRSGGESLFRAAFLEWLEVYDNADVPTKWRWLDVSGTDFQKSVWRALLEIPFGQSTTYGAIAAQLGRPQASRAVGSAVGANPIALLIPCHRVLPATGPPGNYRWGMDLKRVLLDAERESGSDLCSLFK